MDLIKLKAVIFIIVPLFNLLLALLIWSRRRKDKVAFYLGWTAVFSGIYTLAMGGGYFTPHYEGIITFFGRLTWAGAMIMPSFAAFLYYNSRETLKGSKTKASFVYLIFLFLTATIVTIIGVCTNWFTARAWIEDNLIRTEGGLMEYWGRLYASLATLSILFMAARYYLRTSGLKRLQARYFLWGVGIFTFTGLIGAGLIPLIFKNLTDISVEISSFFSFVWVGLTGYAILRYRLLDIRLVIRKIGIYLLTASVMVGIVLLLGFLNTRFINLPLNSFLIFIVIIILSLASSVYHFFEMIASRYFYYTFDSFRHVLEDLNKQLNQTIELNKLTALIEKSCLEAFKSEKASIVIKESGEFHVQTVVGFNAKDIFYLLNQADSFLLTYLKQIELPIVTEEMLFDIKSNRQLGRGEISKIRVLFKEMNRFQIGLLIPLFIKDDLIGMIFLGQKLSGDAYSRQELDLLSTFTAQASVALNNALSYGEIQRRKEELEKFYRLTVNRELKMIELKKQVEKLEE